VVRYSSLVKGMRRIFLFVSSLLEKGIVLGCQIYIEEVCWVFPLEGFPRVNLVYALDVILLVILYMQLLG
jgi:hypothetical protein